MLKDHGYYRCTGIRNYISHYSKARENPMYDTTVTAFLIQAGFDIEHDPASIYNPDKTFELLEVFSRKQRKFKKDPFICAGINAAYRAFARQGNYLKPLERIEDLYKSMKLANSAGIYFKTKREAFPQALEHATAVYYGTKNPKPCVAYARTQRGAKTRLVWGYPLDMTLIESKYAKPLIDKFKKRRSPIAYGMYRYELGARLEHNMTLRNVVSLDYSKFDSTIPSELILVAFNILWTWFENPSLREIEIIEDYFINTPIVMPDGHLYSGKNHGIPSGSMFTNLIGSIVNYILLVAIIEKFELQFYYYKIMVLGDDSIFCTNKDVDLKAIATYIDSLGMKINTQKSEVRKPDQPYHFLGFEWEKGIPRRELRLILLSMSQPEKWRTREKDRHKEMIRALSLIYVMSSLGLEGYTVAKKVLNINQPENLLHTFVNMHGQHELIYDYDWGSDYLNYIWSEGERGLTWPCLPVFLLC